MIIMFYCNIIDNLNWCCLLIIMKMMFKNIKVQTFCIVNWCATQHNRRICWFLLYLFRDNHNQAQAIVLLNYDSQDKVTTNTVQGWLYGLLKKYSFHEFFVLDACWTWIYFFFLQTIFFQFSGTRIYYFFFFWGSYIFCCYSSLKLLLMWFVDCV